MAFKEITSRQNHFVKYMLTLKDKRTRDNERTCLIEGEKILLDLAAEGYPLRMFFVSEKALACDREAAERIAVRSAYNFVTTDSVMRAISSTDTPAGFIAAAETPGGSPLDEDPAEFIRKGLYLCADNIQDPGNMGALFRTAAGFGASGVILHGNCADPFSPKAIRGSAGKTLTLPLIRSDSADFIDAARANGCPTYVTGMRGGVPLDEFEFPETVCIALGNEGCGVSSDLRKGAAGEISIPISENTESLNVSAAAAIITWQWFISEKGSKQKNLKRDKKI